jgi:hypothetical protein
MSDDWSAVGGRMPLWRHPVPRQRASLADADLSLRLVPEAKCARLLIDCSLPASGFEITHGEPEAGWTPSEHRHFFCRRCSNWLFLRVHGTDIINLRTAMLDDPSWFVPYVEIFAANKFPWVSVRARHSFAGLPGPPVFESLMESFAHDGPRSARRRRRYDSEARTTARPNPGTVRPGVLVSSRGGG